VRQYSIDLRSYARARINAGDATFSRNLELCKGPIEQLCDRYQLRGKHILSLGTGDGFEEYWMTPANRLTMVDINDPIAEFSDAARGAGTPADRYFVVDAQKFVSECDDNFDVLYVSSFHPDEFRREALQADFVKVRSPDDAYNYITWKAGTPPYHHTIEDALRLVKNDGLIILQHYRGGIDVTANPQYLRDVIQQFDRHGVRLAELHHFRESPKHLLVTARRCDQTGIRGFQAWIKGRPAITTFHGRYDNPINRDVVRIDDPVAVASSTDVPQASPGSRAIVRYRLHSLIRPITGLWQRR
jgi:hypothetical protein